MRLKLSAKLKLIIIGALVAVPALGLAATAQAQGFRSGTNVSIPNGDTVNSTMFMSGRSVDVAGTVNGDLFCAGQNVRISGTINGDVICAGQSVRVDGTVNGNVRVAGQTVTLGGSVSENLTVVGQSVTADGDSVVAGDASIAGQDVTLNGSVGRDVAIGASTAVLNGTVKRNVQANVEQLSLGNKAVVDGRIDYTSKNQLQRAGGAQVTGEIKRSEPAPKQQQAEQQKSSAIWFGIWLFVSLLLLSLVTVLFIPHIYHRTTSEAMRHLGKVFLVGLIASIVGPFIFIGLLLTVIGIPLAILFLLAWLVLVILSGPFAAFLLGRYMLRGRTDNAIWTMLAGAAVLLVIYFIPFLGQLVALLAFWFGLGMILWQLFKQPKFHYHMADEPGRKTYDL